MKLSISLLFLLVFSVGAVSALELTDDTTSIGVNINPVVITSTTASGGNATGWNTTSLGVLTDASSSQFSSVGGTLTILTSYINAGWCKLTGCTMAGDIDMGGNDITNVGNVTANYFFGDGSGLTGVGGLWTNTSNVATYDGQVNITGNLTRGGCTIWHNGTHTIEDC